MHQLLLGGLEASWILACRGDDFYRAFLMAKFKVGRCVNKGVLKLIFWFICALSSQVVFAYSPDKIDLRAQAQLKKAIEKQLKLAPEWPVESALKALEIKQGLTVFSNIQQDRSDVVAHFPTHRPLGVTADEWQALQNSNIDAGGENGSANYTLIDLNDDGKRDLLLDSYMGGTGLYHYVSAMQRKGNQFIGAYPCLQKAECVENVDAESVIYALNGRGSNQAATWVRLQGRIYAAYRDGHYGADHIYLLRPFVDNAQTPVIAVNYQYAFSVPKAQQHNEKKLTLDNQTQTALLKGLALANPSVAQDNNNNAQTKGCPAPENATEDERWGYAHFGAGHYTFEIVDNFPVWFGTTCYIAQLVNWFGAYDKALGLRAQIWLKLPNIEEAEEQEYQVIGRRTVIKIKSYVGKALFKSE